MNRPKEKKRKYSAGEVLICLIALLVALLMSRFMPVKWGIAKQMEDEWNAATASPTVTVTPEPTPAEEASPTPAPEGAQGE